MASVSKSQLQKLLDEYWERVLRMTGMDPSTPMPNVEVGNLGENPAATGSGVITFDADYLKNASLADIRGALVHEATHAAYEVDTAGNPQAKKIIEPLANAIRYQITGTAGGWKPDEEAMRLVDLAPWQLRVVQQSLVSGQFSNALLKKLEDGTLNRTEAKVYTSETQTQSMNPTGNDGDGGGGPTGQAPPGWMYVEGPDGNPMLVPDLGGATEDEKAPDWRTTSWQENKDQQTANFNSYLVSYGIPTTPEMQNLVQQAIKNEWNEAMFLEELRGSQEYRDRFPGIFDKDGTLKMTEGEYINAEKQYGAYASQFGINMGQKRMAYLFRNDVTPEEFADRGEAFSRLNRNKDLYGAFKRELVQAGVAKPGDVNTNKELFKFVMGEGNKAWYDLWQDAVTRNAAVTAGITFGKNQAKYTALRQGVIEKISSMGLSEAEMAQKFLEVEGILSDVLPTTEAGLYGVNKKDAVKAAFGGKGSSKARDQIERAVTTADAFSDSRAAAAVYSDDQGNTVTQGVTDRRRRSQSDY